MILIGMFDSPFVRRVAVSMNLLGMSYEHRNWSVGKDFDQPPPYKLQTLVDRCEAMPVFKAVRVPFFTPSPT